MAPKRAEVALPMVRVDVLGPLRLTVDGKTVDVPGPKRRALLALLVMADGRAATVDGLLDALWPDDLPDSARATLQSHVSRLRRHLGAAGPRLEGVPGAYRLRLDDNGSGSDVARARSLFVDAAAAQPAEAGVLLDEARSLWRGTPLAEFADVPPLAAWAVTLGEFERSIGQARAAAALDAGATGEAVELATALVAADPLSEPAAVVLMRALAASGRAADALRAGHELRRRLADTSGLEPSPALAELERAIAATTSSPRPRSSRPANRLHGRDSELAALHRLVRDERLVTVLGPGGVGKTRLAVELAARADRATVLPLASVTDVAAIPDALADELELRVVHGDVLPACAALLAAGPQLLVVDNCEHLLAGVRQVVGILLDSCPELTVVATSREPLGLPAEQRLRIAPLPLSRPDGSGDLSRSPAVAVFVDRARRVRSAFEPGPDDLGVVEDIVRRLDGIPLAIELAAGRLSSLDVRELQARLDRSLDLLADGGTTLRRTLEWSYELLPEHERVLFRHLGVFPDGFDLETAEWVGAEVEPAVDAAATVGHLVDASMVEAAFVESTRYRMLDTMRSFAADRLDALGEGDDATELFLRWTRGLVTWVDETLCSADEPQADRRLRRELANIRAAWAICRSQHRLDDAVHIAARLSDAAGWRDLTEVWGWQLELADDPHLTGHPARSRMLGLAAGCAWGRGELERAEAMARAGLDIDGDDSACVAALAMVALSRGELAAAVDLATRAAAAASRPDQSLGVAALAAAYGGDLDEAAPLAAELAATAPSPTLEAFGEYVAAEIDLLAGDTQRAEQRYGRATTLARQSGSTFVDGLASVGLATLRSRAGDLDDAFAQYGKLIDYWDRTGGWVQQWTTLRNLAQLLRSAGDEETAAFLEGAADSAPDAPAAGTRPPGVPDGGPDPVRAEAVATGRARVLEVARAAIGRFQRKGLDQPPRPCFRQHGAGPGRGEQHR